MTGDGSQPRLLRTVANGIELAAFEWHPQLRGRGPTLVFAHATGFHARCWDAVIRRLGARHAIAVDLRGHGRSQKAPYEGWRAFGDDLAALLTELRIAGAVGIGHSMGAHATVVAAADRPALFERLVLVDPVILAPDAYAARSPEPPRAAVGRSVARRRNRFATVEEMIARFADREPYSLFVREAFEDYCRYGLLPASDGDGLELACPPAFEASVYDGSRSNVSIYRSVRAVRVPVTLVRAVEPRTPRDLASFLFSPTWPSLAGVFSDVREHYLPERSHFVPMEDPALTARLIDA